MSDQTHWTHKHIQKCNNLNLWIAFDEVGSPLSIHNTKIDAKKALIKYAEYLEYEEAVYGDHNLR